MYGGWWTKNSESVYKLSTDANKFSVMGYLDQLTYQSGIYQFRLEYPGYTSTAYNEWTQTSNPMNYSQSISSYTPIHIDWSGTNTTNGAFCGISKWPSHSSCWMKSYTTLQDWWFAMFSYQYYSSTYGIPGPIGGSASSSGTLVTEVALWLRTK